ncbi:MAG: helix-turn-helix domain-containing protein [Caulobacterales bacterium]
MKPTHVHVADECRAVSETLARIGDKWSVQTVALLGEGPKRFSELRREIGAVSQKMLTSTLRNLERDGFVTRTIYPTIPPRVDYALTELGYDLLGPVKALGDWAKTNQPRIAAAREAFDRARAATPKFPFIAP